jgi:hypothetical protein
VKIKCPVVGQPQTKWGKREEEMSLFINDLPTKLLPLTARQYGEVVLPDESTGQGPGTPRQRGQKAVTVQGGYGALFAVQVQSFVNITRVAVQG